MKILPRPWLAVSQPNYVPWLGYFDMIDAVDQFLTLDTVQYTRRDWRNRNRIKSPGGVKWMTIPIKVPRDTVIGDVNCDDLSWRDRHLAQLQGSYRDAACFDEVMPLVTGWYETVPSTRLVDINEHFTRAIMAELAIQTPLRRASELDDTKGRSQRFVDLCLKLGARTYVSGPAAQSYLDVDLFAQAGIAVGWFDFSYDYEYAQPNGPFERNVSALDPLLCIGHHARGLMRSGSPGFVVPDEGFKR